MKSETLHISSSPHIRKPLRTDKIMQNVVWALLPTTFYAVYAFGLGALLIITVTVVSCVLTEYLLCKISGKPSTIKDWSAVITGLLLGLILPPAFPLWMAFVGGIISIALGKFIFGGLGYNVFNPALVGRAVLQAAFPVAITTWHPGFMAQRFMEIPSSVLAFPFMSPVVDATSGATPLSAFKFDGLLASTNDLAMGVVHGSIGETHALLIVLGGLYLAWRKMLNWRIPAAILGTVYLFSTALYFFNPGEFPPPTFMLFSGGLMLGAVFMATDMVGSPLTGIGMIIYGVFIGALVVIIRIWGGLPEGVMYAILLGNALAPQIDRLVKNRVYGTQLKTQKA